MRLVKLVVGFMAGMIFGLVVMPILSAYTAYTKNSWPKIGGDK